MALQVTLSYPSPIKGNGVMLSQEVIVSGAKQSLFSAETASSLALLAMTDIR